MPDFIPGLQLSELFYKEAVKPILDADFPGLTYSAALIGGGSEVLGFDTAMSTDHHWGPRALLFLSEADYNARREAIHDALSRKLPVTFRGYSTHFSPPNPDDNGTQFLQPVESGPVNHRVELFTIKSFFEAYLNVDPDADLTPEDWLTLPEQKLRTIIGGKVFHDDAGLNRVRGKFAYYPHEVWLYLLAAGWRRIGQEEHFVGRAGALGDELGSQLIAARLVRDLMRLCFLMEKQYAPYSKWFGTAFERLRCAALLSPIFRRVLLAETWQERERHLCNACEMVAEMHNALEITRWLPAEVSDFHGRPFKVIHGDVFVKAIIEAITDEAVKRIASRALIGSVDQFSDSADLLENAPLRPKLRRLYGD